METVIPLQESSSSQAIARSLFILLAYVFLLSNPSSASLTGDAAHWLEMGHSYLLNGSFQQAADSFDRVLKIDPENVSAWSGKGAALLGLGRYKMAMLYLDFALQKDPKNPRLWLEEAKAAEQDGNWRQAGTGYDRALALNGSLAEAWLGIGNVSIATGHYDLALQSFTNASRFGLKDAAREGEYRVQLARGQSFLQQGNFEEALQFYDRILVNNPSDPMAKEGKSRALVGQGQLQLARGNNSQARGIFEEAILLDPMSQDAMQGQLQALRNDGDELMAKGLFSDASDFRAIADDACPFPASDSVSWGERASAVS